MRGAIRACGLETLVRLRLRGSMPKCTERVGSRFQSQEHTGEQRRQEETSGPQVIVHVGGISKSDVRIGVAVETRSAQLPAILTGSRGKRQLPDHSETGGARWPMRIIVSRTRAAVDQTITGRRSEPLDAAVQMLRDKQSSRVGGEAAVLLPRPPAFRVICVQRGPN